eukprot:5665618-Heterocapsa_arctica.AAC.1
MKAAPGSSSSGTGSPNGRRTVKLSSGQTNTRLTASPRKDDRRRRTERRRSTELLSYLTAPIPAPNAMRLHSAVAQDAYAIMWPSPSRAT